MKLDREIFLSVLLAGGLIGTAACGGPEPVEEEEAPVTTTGSEEMFESEPVETSDGLDPVAEEPEEDMGPTPE
jgi:hypothetical protein